MWTKRSGAALFVLLVAAADALCQYQHIASCVDLAGNSLLAVVGSAHGAYGSCQSRCHIEDLKSSASAPAWCCYSLLLLPTNCRDCCSMQRSIVWRSSAGAGAQGQRAPARQTSGILLVLTILSISWTKPWAICLVVLSTAAAECRSGQTWDA